MNTNKNKSTKTTSKQKEIEVDEIWNDENLAMIRAHIKAESEKQSPERKLRNKMLSIKYKIHDYLDNEETISEMKIYDFVKQYLELFGMTQKKFASILEMKDSNLNKYLKGERKLNPDLVLKLSSFCDTEPQIWYYIEVKNELIELKKESTFFKKYSKYEFKNYVDSNKILKHA